jgi:chromosome segregation ATPase
LKISESKTKELKQIIKNSGIDKDYVQAGKETIGKIVAGGTIAFLQEEDSQLTKYTSNDKNHNYLVNKLKKRQNQKKIEKTTNQLLIESLDKRGNALQFLYQNYSENNFQNNVNIIKKKNKELYFSQSGRHLTNNEQKEEKPEDNSQQFKSKIDAIISNFEAEKKAKNEEINELNSKLLNIKNSIDNLKNSHSDNTELKNNLNELLSQLSEENTELLKGIEDAMVALEQMKKMQNKELEENEIASEVEKLEKKYQDMQTNWADYANQAKNQIQELKTSIDVKKKEYQYKYEQINKLKKEIEEIANKIAMKQELAQFLNDEYGKITVHINRNIFVNKISDLTKKINDERKKVSQYLVDLQMTDKRIETMNANIKKVDNDLEDILFKDAKNNSKLKDVYTAFMNLRNGYNICQKNIIEVSIQKNKLNELFNQVDDYKEKIQNYDIKQLTEQIELLKQANKGK